ncbi:MAG: aminotransferase class III-fold pyridoxal phosphate-dependent enzyme [Betaproteobacteria bacterium]|nr:aminotransferase class III-fold pyridoxal phosphate-dependent enzyme [Betaproteobacteria bacterium]
MNILLPNSPAARDAAYHIHPQTNLRKLKEEGALVITRGEGCRIFDDGGKDYIEAAAGLWCASLGFNASERVARVAYEQMKKLAYYHTYRQRTHPAIIDLSEKLLSLAPKGMSKAIFQCSGSEANDTAIKLVWYYHHAIGKPQKTKIISRKFGYHGNTIGAASVSGKPDMHADFGLPLPMMRHTEFPHYYRFHQDGESEEQFATRMAEALEQMILAEGPETVGGFFAEPVMGAGGGIVPPRTYFAKIQAVLRKYEVLFVADEVICGFGRTGNWWGSQTFDLQPDMMSCAKALSAAFQPISALLINEKIYGAMLAQSDKHGAFAHGYTHSGHPVAAAVALEVLRIYQEMDLISHVRRMSTHFLGALAKFAEHPLIGDVRGVGLVAGMELVADKATRMPFAPAGRVGGVFDRHAKKHGLIARLVGDRVVFSPPLIIDEAEIDEMLRRCRAALDDTLGEIHRAAA